MRSRMVRRLHSRKRSGVVSQQRLRLRRLDSLVKRSPKLRSEPVSFLFLVCFYKNNRDFKLNLALPYSFFQIIRIRK
eukprot:UN13127